MSEDMKVTPGVLCANASLFRRKAKGEMQLNLEHHYKQPGGDKCLYFLMLKKSKWKYVVLIVCLCICRKNAGGSADRTFMLRRFLMSICTVQGVLHAGFCLRLCSVYVCNLLVEAVSPIKRKTLCAQF